LRAVVNAVNRAVVARAAQGEAVATR